MNNLQLYADDRIALGVEVKLQLARVTFGKEEITSSQMQMMETSIGGKHITSYGEYEEVLLRQTYDKPVQLAKVIPYPTTSAHAPVACGNGRTANQRNAI